MSDNVMPIHVSGEVGKCARVKEEDGKWEFTSTDDFPVDVPIAQYCKQKR